MKNKLKIILCIVSCVCVLFCSSFSVFASDVNCIGVNVIKAGEYTFNDVLSDYSQFVTDSLTVKCDYTSNGYDFMEIKFRNSSQYGDCLVYVLSGADENVYIYSPNLGWIDDNYYNSTVGVEFKTIVIEEDSQVPEAFYNWFIENTTYAGGFNLYDSIYKLIVKYVFNNQGLTSSGILSDSSQHLIVTSLSTIAWVFVIAIPFTIVWWLIMVVTTGFRRF